MGMAGEEARPGGGPGWRRPDETEVDFPFGLAAGGGAVFFLATGGGGVVFAGGEGGPEEAALAAA